MASASTLHPPFLAGLHRPAIKSNFLQTFQVRRNPNPDPTNFYSKKSPISAAASSDPSPSSSWEREEIRWLREEQRWLREEQRWLREEQRWRSERESLIREIAALRLKIEALERGRSSPPPPSDAVDATISDVGARPARVEEAEVKKIIFEEVVRVSDEKEKVEERNPLRMGSEGEEVRAMQEALLKLGFYSGEEDMEYSSFSTGTERAVKTWQASLGTVEDGIMTNDLLDRLFMEKSLMEHTNQGGDSVSGAVKDVTNGTPIVSMSEIAEIKETVIKETGDAEVEISAHRVFLLGENRWEEPSRLKGRDKPISGSKAVSVDIPCLSCRGEGRLMCAECDGSGEPNIEPQFLEWIGEDAKCPYCEGLGYTTCDVCEGKGVARSDLVESYL